jgi:hypothetical protein
MSDHRIIFEASWTASASSETVPDISKTATEPSKEETSSTVSVQTIISTAKNPVGALMGKVATAIPWVGAAIAVAAVGVQITDDCLDFSTIKSGDYGLQMSWSNLKTGVSNFMNPIGYAVSGARQQTEADAFNKSQVYNRELMGVADVNTFGKRRV